MRTTNQAWGLASVLLSACSTGAMTPPPTAAPRARARTAPIEVLATELAAGLPSIEPRPPEEVVPPQPRPHPAPPLFGGTLLVTRDGALAVASDPERDRVWVTDLGTMAVTREVPLASRDEPGVLTESDDGRVHVVLRRGGALLSFDPRGDAPPLRRPVCPAPRGVASRGDRVVVACAGGELVKLDGDDVTTRQLPADLRDVGFHADGSLWATRFRSARRLRVTDEAVEEVEIPTVMRELPGLDPIPFGARVAWRTIAAGDGVEIVLHQRERKAPLANIQEYYGEVGGALMGAVTVFEDGEPRASHLLPSNQSVLPIDATVLDDGWLAMVLGGDGGVSRVHPASGRVAHGPLAEVPGWAVAIARHGDGLVVQYREPTAIARFDRLDEIGGAYVALGAPLVPDRGHRLFHQATAQGVACASCHPEGLDDGHTWSIPERGLRRTQPLTGGLLGSAPFHWSGELATFDALMVDVFERRMGGDPLPPEDVAALGRWIDALPDPVGSERETPAVARGRRLFEDPRVGCATCHAGERGTDGRAYDVGTGGAFQTPALVGLSQRAPYLHDGCAETLEARFAECHTRGHGQIEQLAPEQVTDLVTYLRTR